MVFALLRHIRRHFSAVINYGKPKINRSSAQRQTEQVHVGRVIFRNQTAYDTGSPKRYR
jgi:hypothetical protein